MGTNSDWRDQKMKAEAEKARADKLNVYVAAGALSPMQMLNAAVDAGDLDEAFLPEDATEAGNVNDNEKLISGERQSLLPVVTPLPSNTPQTQGAQPGVTKDADPTDELMDHELGAALVWARKARGDESH